MSKAKYVWYGHKGLSGRVMMDTGADRDGLRVLWSLTDHGGGARVKPADVSPVIGKDLEACNTLWGKLEKKECLMIVKNKEGTLYKLDGLQWDESGGSWLVSLTSAPWQKDGVDRGHEVRLPLESFHNHFTLYVSEPSPMTFVGIKCNECGNTLPEHTEAQHLDGNDPVHQCPHEEDEDGNDGT